MEPSTLNNLNLSPSRLRRTILDMAYSGSTVHIACAFSIVEILSVLYGKFLRFPGNNCNAASRDFMILSKGHGVMAQYACMKELGWLSSTELKNYFQDGSKLKGLSDSRTPGLEVTSGSLGHGFSIGVGIAYGNKLKGNNSRVFSLVGDGELNEGAIWEGALFAATHQLKNFLVVVDENGLQAMGKTADILNLGSIEDKFSSFGFETYSVDGHSESAIEQVVARALHSRSRAPKAIVAKTIKGRGISFMEGQNSWHYTRMNVEQYESACAELGMNEL